ncbi:hypothetical protein T484DRAFT_1785801 [Baffinella frigidus]|nr:hypothetical protein T484DRAFT_1785801 [Cryptophyta sp. CCMP2293]
MAGIVVCSLLIAAGICGIGQVGATLIISEVIPFLVLAIGVLVYWRVPEYWRVIPFLVLAIGVDNIFILTFAFDLAPTVDPRATRDPNRSGLSLGSGGTGEGQAAGGYNTPRDTPAVVVNGSNSTAVSPLDGPASGGGMLAGEVGPSILGAAAAEIGAFLLGSLTGMPAVVCFAQFAAAAMTLFVAALAVIDRAFPPEAPARRDEGQLGQRLLDAESGSGGGGDGGGGGGVCTRWVLNADYRRVVLGVSMILVGVSTFSASQVELGLEQTDALPTDSFLVDYFQDVATFLQVLALTDPLQD